MSHTTPTDDLAPNQREWLRELQYRLPLVLNGTFYTTVEEVLEDFDMPEDERVVADREWYREAMEEYEREWEEWKQASDEDPPSKEDLETAQVLWDHGYLKPIRLELPVLQSGVKEVIETPAPPPKWLIEEEAKNFARVEMGVEQIDDSPSELGVGRLSDEPTKALFYTGMDNSIFGPGDAFKTWLACCVAMEAILQRRHVAWFNFEARSPLPPRSRLISMGVPASKVDMYFHFYDHPSQTPRMKFQVSLVIIDALNPAIRHLGLNSTSDPGGPDAVVAKFIKPLRDRNSMLTSVIIDHTNKSNDKDEGGHARKHQFTQAAKYRLNLVKRSARGSKGYAKIFLAKDNGGMVIPNDDLGVAYISVDSSHVEDATDVQIVSELPLGRSETRSQRVEKQSAKSVALAILRDQQPISRNDWNTAMEKAGIKSGDSRRRAVADLKREGVAVQNSDGDWIEETTD